ncbi:uncharacterized protein LOC131255720 isoform X2 [Magnolia sinica]|uniref:uncharacterized protein LOC131255720 isoform X2 n=1 Tax=Magnolia sinica TaxID=86752 RepID=UPI002658CB23|nr:uncharacterized protein LOC131255720 isoform X2 [Magnolia sinica]
MEREYVEFLHSPKRRFSGLEAPEPMEIEFMYQIIRYLLDSFDYTTSSKYLLQSEPTSSNLVTHWIAGLWTAKTISPTVPSMFNKLMYEVA